MALLASTGCAGPLPPPDPPNLAGAKESLASGHEQHKGGCYREAETNYLAALEQARLSDNVLLLIRSLNSLGASLLAQGKVDEAAIYLEQAMNTSLGQPGQPELDKVLGNLGSLAFKMKRYEDAENFWKNAAETARESGLSPAPYYCDLARLYLAMSRDADFTEMAAVALQEAGGADEPAPDKKAGSSVEKKTVPDPATLADALNLAGNSARRAGNLQEAENFYRRALELDRNTENTAGLAQDTEALGLLLLERGDIKEAVSFFDRAFFLWAALSEDQHRDRVFNMLKKLSQEHKTPVKLEPYSAARRDPAPYRLSSRCP